MIVKCMPPTSCWKPSSHTFKVCNQPCYLRQLSLRLKNMVALFLKVNLLTMLHSNTACIQLALTILRIHYSACVTGRSSDIFRTILTRVRSFQHSSGDNVQAIQARANRNLCGSFESYARIKRPGSTRQETWHVQNR